MPRASKFGRVLTRGLHKVMEDSTKSCDHFITCISWSREKLENFYLHFNIIYCSQTWGTQSLKSRELLTKLLRGHYLLNIFKASVAIVLKILNLLSVLLCFLDVKIILMLLFNFQKHFSIDVLKRRCSKNMQQTSEHLFLRTPLTLKSCFWFFQNFYLLKLENLMMYKYINLYYSDKIKLVYLMSISFLFTDNSFDG